MPTKLWLRVDLGDTCRVGPGKVRLLEAIADTGSISGAGRAMGMSYKRAWDLSDALNRSFKGPLVTTHVGGRGRGGAELTDLGRAVVAHYRAMEVKAAQATALHLDALKAAMEDPVDDGHAQEAGKDIARVAVPPDAGSKSNA